MKKRLLVLMAVFLGFTTLAFGWQIAPAVAKESKILDFDTMIGLPRPYTGAANAIRGIPGGGLPWVVGSAYGKLKQDGRIDITIKGLVFDPNDPVVITRGIGGTNTIASFKAIVSCLSKDAEGNATVVNVSTGLFPADTAGNAVIDDVLSLPSPCIAPIVFVTSPGGAWFAASGY